MEANAMISNARISSSEFPRLDIPAHLYTIPVTDTKQVFEIVKQFGSGNTERGLILTLDTQDKIISVHLVSIGGRDSATISICDILREAIIEKASGIIFVHNHPTGALIPSETDREFCGTLEDDADVLGIEVVDCVIINEIGFQSLYAPENNEDNKGSLARWMFLAIFSSLEEFPKMMIPMAHIRIAIIVMIMYYGIQTGESLPQFQQVMWLVILYPFAWFAGAIGTVGKTLLERL